MEIIIERKDGESEIKMIESGKEKPCTLKSIFEKIIKNQGIKSYKIDNYDVEEAETIFKFEMGNKWETLTYINKERKFIYDSDIMKDIKEKDVSQIVLEFEHIKEEARKFYEEVKSENFKYRKSI